MPATLDELSAGAPVQIRREVLLPVRFALLGRPGNDARAGPDRLRASALAAAVPALVGREPARPASGGRAASNADAARDVSRGVGRRGARGRVRRGAVRAGGARPRRARRRGRDHPLRPGRTAADPAAARPARTGPRVVAYERDDHPGALLEMLTEFAVRGVNLTRLESRPTGHGPRQLLLLARLRRPHRRRAGGRGAVRAAPDLRRRALPRLLSARGREDAVAAARRWRTRTSRRRTSGSTASAGGMRARRRRKASKPVPVEVASGRHHIRLWRVMAQPDLRVQCGRAPQGRGCPAARTRPCSSSAKRPRPPAAGLSDPSSWPPAGQRIGGAASLSPAPWTPTPTARPSTAS